MRLRALLSCVLSCSALVWLGCGVTAPSTASAAEKVELKPNGLVQLEFPQLPPTLEGALSGESRPPMLSALLPENYSPSGKFPIFVYINGYSGGFGDKLEPGRSVIGAKDFICVNLPLFRKSVDRGDYQHSILVKPEDYEVLSRGYKAMLERFAHVVPNIASEGNVFGGHSNGAHATAVLLARKDPFIISRFDNFYFHEGGYFLKMDAVLTQPPFSSRRILVMVGDAPKGRSKSLKLMRDLQTATSGANRHITFVVMKGYGHEQPPDYLAMIGQWARREPLREPAPGPR